MNPRKYIWLSRESDDSYAQFQDVFSCEAGPVILEITADYQFAAYINGELAANSQYADLPDYKAISRYDITALCTPGENTLLIKAWHPGADYFQCHKMTACIRYAVLSGEAVLAQSSENTLCRADTAYRVGTMLTPQLGMGYCYDFTAEPAPWEKARVVEPGFAEIDKPIPNTELLDMPASPVVSGAYMASGGDTPGAYMQHAWQRPLNSMLDTFPAAIQAEAGDGVYLLMDLGQESAGYPYFSLTCGERARAWLGWGEQLVDGRIRTEIGIRSFAVELTLRAGENDFSDHLRRLGCRYLCLYIETKLPVTLHRAGLLEEHYPVAELHRDFGDRLLNLLYSVGRRTLELCMHQHYEDCPWREQALYGMDSRNQMLFGYTVFGEKEFPRANLRLMARSLAEDGLLHLCPPSRSDITIPSFTAYWVLACYENALADYREDFVKEVLPPVRRALEVFRANTVDGMVHTLGDKRYWNFHEWIDGLDGGEIYRDEPLAPIPDALLTAICCRAAEAAAKLEAMAGEPDQEQRDLAFADALAAGFQKFYVPEKGLFASYLPGGRPEGFHEMTQGLMLSTGRLQGEVKENIIRALTEGADMIPQTLASLLLTYEGLMNYAGMDDYVLEDMIRRFQPMARQDSTYWETALGQRDFDNAGSMCHGWSAMPCYVLDRIYGK